MTVQFRPLAISKKISAPTLASLVTYLDTFARGEFMMGFEADRMMVRFADRSDRALLAREFPGLVEAVR